jgi:hypothetical protein
VGFPQSLWEPYSNLQAGIFQFVFLSVIEWKSRVSQTVNSRDWGGGLVQFMGSCSYSLRGPFVDELDWCFSLGPPFYKQNAISHFQSFLNAYKHFQGHIEVITQNFEILSFTLRSVLILGWSGLLAVPYILKKNNVLKTSIVERTGSKYQISVFPVPKTLGILGKLVSMRENCLQEE